MPLITILIPVRDAASTIGRTLDSLLPQCEGNDAEVVLAVSDNDSSLAALDVPSVVRVVTVKSPAGVPQLRRVAAFEARGQLLVITEDHCTFPADWLRNLLLAARAKPGSVCGGPVKNGRLTYVGWAQYFTRYSAFLPTGCDRRVSNLPGNNACYPAALIEARRPFLRDGFWEAEFNQQLARAGVPFLLAVKLAVTQHQERRALEYVSLRFRHGRCYGARRQGQRVKLILASPLLPALLFWRMLRAPLHRARFLLVSPLVLLYVVAWSAGEFFGYLTGAGSSCTETD